VKEKLKEKGMMIICFLGTTVHTVNLKSLLHYLCKSISFIYSEEKPSLSEDIGECIEMLNKKLKLASAEKPLYLFLDSVDQLSSTDQAHKMKWLPVELPPHVQMMVSTLPNPEIGCFDHS